MAAKAPICVDVPARYPTALFFVDESGSRASSDQFFVVGAIKVREPGSLMRGIKSVRDRHHYVAGELKFSQVTRDKLPIYYDVIDELEASDAHIAACVVDRSTGADPFKGSLAPWEAHARVIAQLLVGNINRRELASVLMDGIPTPTGCSLEDTVKDLVNRKLGTTSLVTAACLDSRSTDGLQIADLVAGAIAFSRKKACDTYPGAVNPHKLKVATRLGGAFGLTGFADVHNDRVNVATYRARAPRDKTTLRVVTKNMGKTG